MEPLPFTLLRAASVFDLWGSATVSVVHVPPQLAGRMRFGLDPLEQRDCGDIAFEA
jgi:hypothetical protein